jgi:hypothetical protein
MGTDLWTMCRWVIKKNFISNFIYLHFFYSSGKLFTLRLGSNSLTANDASLTRVSSDSYFLHPDFNPETLENDVGLIKLRMPITYSGNTTH